jgi:hypothetical protein
MVPTRSKTLPSRIVLLTQLVDAFLLATFPLAAQQQLSAASIPDKPKIEASSD